MAILANRDSTVMIQGISGKQGSLHTKFMLEYGVNIAAGVTPGKGGSEVHGVPVYNSPAEAISMHRSIDAALIMVPAPFVLDAGSKAIQQNIPLIVIITEHVPIHDTMKLKWLAGKNDLKLVGPNTIGVISPGKCKVGIMPASLYSEGRVGIISRSGTMTHEIASSLTRYNTGQSTCVGIGGDPVTGLGFADTMELFLTDEETDLVILIGEIGGFFEEQAASYMKKVKYPKPVFAFIGGKTAPAGKKMGHAGALISGASGTAEAKARLLENAGVSVASTVKELVESVSAYCREGQ